MKKILKISSILIITLVLTAFTSKKKYQNKQFNSVETPSLHSDNQYIKVALLLDTSNSMDGLIDQAKAQLWEIVNELSYAKCDVSKPKLQIALYEYGNDRLNSREGYIRQVLAFSDDLDEISKELFSLTTDGGNEYCGQVIQTSLNQLEWGSNEDDLKLIFIAGNEPFTQGKISYKEAAIGAHKKDISVNTIFCGDYNQGISSYWKDGADLAHGDYMAINHNQATVHVSSPYDDRILQLNIKLNKTYVAYGAIGNQKMAMQLEQDTNASGYSRANAVSRTVSKSSHLYTNSGWDLIDAEAEADFSYETLKTNDLPPELKDKSKAEIKSYISKKRADREHIQNDIQSLNLKRKNYIREQRTSDNNGLENALLNAIKKQAKQKNYQW